LDILGKSILNLFMNKIIIVIVIIFSGNVSISQNYKFDKLFSYNSSLQSEPKNIYCNSYNNNIFLQIRRDTFGLYASLEDLNKGEYHRYKVETIKIENDLQINFIYEYTRKSEIHNIGNQTYEYETIFEDSIYSKGLIKIYKNKKKKKLLKKYEITVLKRDIDYFNIYRYLFIHPFENNKNIFVNIGGIVQKASFFNGEINIDLELISVNDVNVNIIVPQKKNIKTFSY
jgi:hypothetical protein